MRFSFLAVTLALAASTAKASILPDLGFSSVPDTREPVNGTNLIFPCGSDEDLLTIDYVNLTPEPPKRGQTLSIDAKGYLKEPIVEGATINILVKAGLIKLLQQELQFCDESTKVNKPCPVEQGEQYLKHEVELPKEIPPAIYTVHVVVKNPDGKQVTCLDAKANFKLIPKF